jgi:hypothetical protein
MAMLMVLLMALAPLSGCFGDEGSDPSSSDLSVNPGLVAAGYFQLLSLRAGEDMSVTSPT